MTLSAYWRIASDRGKFYRHAGEYAPIGANYTGGFIGILENSLSQEQTILVILSAYREQPHSGINYTGDFIGIQ